MFSFFKKKTGTLKTEEEISKPVLPDESADIADSPELSEQVAANIETSPTLAKPEEEKNSRG